MHQRDVDTVWLRRYAVLVACSTLALVIAGGLVTGNDAALSIPDWPLNWGRLIPPLHANIRYEFAHRALALIVTLLIGGLASRLRTQLARAALGGVLVRFVDPAPLAVMHAALAQLLFGITVAIAVSPTTRDRKGALAPALLVTPIALFAQTILGAAVRHRIAGPLPHIVGGAIATIFVMWAGLGTLMTNPGGAKMRRRAVALFAQTILGAAVRHRIAGPLPHIVGAAIATIFVMWAGLGTLMTNPGDAKMRRRATPLLGHTFTQIALGIAAYIARDAAEGAPQPIPVVVWITVAHTAMGSLVFGSAIALAISGQARKPALQMVTA